jgi:ADP-ribose pyrophosphatase YjhB (NUDIX family)
MKSSSFCDNCGNQGHQFNVCAFPIISMGIVAFKYVENELNYLMICRKNSFGFIEFMRGRYPLYDRKYISNLIDEMSNEEKRMLLEYDFKKIWIHLWGGFIGSQYKNEESRAEEKFNQLKRGVHVFCNEMHDLDTLLSMSETCWDTPEWGFPKGRRDYNETDIKCAMREFNEETGYSPESLDIIKNLSPFEEIFMGSNYKTYKHKYYLANLRDCEPVNEYQKSEVSDIRLVSFDDAISLIRPYNKDKIQTLIDINTTLLEYRLIS